jgi:hypothetical protein
MTSEKDPIDEHTKEFFNRNSEGVRVRNEEFEAEYDQWDHYRNLYHEKELRYSDGTVIGQIYVEKAINNTLRIKCLFGGRDLPFKPNTFKLWITEEGLGIF